MTAGNVPGIKGALFKKALQAKLDRLHSTGAVTHALWDRLVFRKVIISSIKSIYIWKSKELCVQIQAVLGGQIQIVGSGSAPISPQVMDFLKIALACEVAEGMPYLGSYNCYG